MFHGFRSITKSKKFPTDWCSTDPTVPSDGEKCRACRPTQISFFLRVAPTTAGIQNHPSKMSSVEEKAASSSFGRQTSTKMSFIAHKK